MALDSRSAVPLYAQLKNILKREIQQGKYTEQLPTETELMEAFITSRTTVRQAVSALVREGVLQKIQGKGTFIASRTANVWLGVLSSLTEVIEKHVKPGGPGTFVMPGLMKINVVKKPARAARKGINPFTGEEIMIKARPAYKAVKIKALKKLKEMVTA